MSSTKDFEENNGCGTLEKNAVKGKLQLTNLGSLDAATSDSNISQRDST
jgi:hypothetical protein